jgi:hypothetical protein
VGRALARVQSGDPRTRGVPESSPVELSGRRDRFYVVPDPACYRDYCPACNRQVTIVDEECPACGADLPRADDGGQA